MRSTAVALVILASSSCAVQGYKLLTPGKAFRQVLIDPLLIPRRAPPTVALAAAAAAETADANNMPDTALKGPAGLNRWDPSAQQAMNTKWIEPAMHNR